MKATSSFKLPRHVKTRLATIADPHQRGLIRRSMIDAIMTAQEQDRRSTRGDKASRNDD